MVKIVWTDLAIQDLEDIGNYIAKDSERYAQMTVEKLFTSVDILEHYPKIGKIVPEFQDELIRELIMGNFRIVYQIVNDERVDIITVNHCARLIGNTYNFPDIGD